jgi:hypothetical protein
MVLFAGPPRPWVVSMPNLLEAKAVPAVFSDTQSAFSDCGQDRQA